MLQTKLADMIDALFVVLLYVMCPSKDTQNPTVACTEHEELDVDIIIDTRCLVLQYSVVYIRVFV